MVDPLVLEPLLKALGERLQVALVLPAEVPVALDLVAAALVVDQVIVVPEPMVLPAGDLAETQALTAETQAMEHPVVTQAMEHPVVTQAIAVLEAIALPAEARVMTDHPAMETMGPPAAVMAAVMAVATVVGTAAVMAAETSRPDDLVFINNMDLHRYNSKGRIINDKPIA